MSAALDRLDQVLAAFTGALLAALTVVVTFQVLGRYVPFIPRPLWTEEISRSLLAWLVFVGAAVMLRRSEHFLIDLIPRRVDAKFGRGLQLAALAVVVVVSVVLLVGGVLMTQGGLTRISTASGLHRAWSFAAVPVGGLLMVVFSLELAIKVIRREPLPDPGGGPGSVASDGAGSPGTPDTPGPTPRPDAEGER